MGVLWVLVADCLPPGIVADCLPPGIVADCLPPGGLNADTANKTFPIHSNISLTLKYFPYTQIFPLHSNISLTLKYFPYTQIFPLHSNIFLHSNIAQLSSSIKCLYVLNIQLKTKLVLRHVRAESSWNYG